MTSIPLSKNPTPTEFCELFDACPTGREFAERFESMAEVWDNCKSVAWLFWIVDRLGLKVPDKSLRLFAVWCARSTPLADGRVVEDLLTDPRSLEALKVAERFANGDATQEELDAAGAAAGAAAWPAARYAAWPAAYAADAARYAAWPAAYAADAARYAAGAAAGAAAYAAGAAAGAAARSAADAVGSAELRKYIPNPFK